MDFNKRNKHTHKCKKLKEFENWSQQADLTCISLKKKDV